jgi:hypothetical protein
MKAITITQMILRAAVLLALILGIIFWANPAMPALNPGLKDFHMLLGIIVVLALWTLGLLQARVKGGSSGLAAGAFVVGLIVVIVGLWQESWKGSGANVELINTIHLLLGLLAVGLGEMIGGRSKRLAKAEAKVEA